MVEGIFMLDDKRLISFDYGTDTGTTTCEFEPMSDGSVFVHDIFHMPPNHTQEAGTDG